MKVSRAIALVRFNDGTILRGCYNGTSDFLSQWLITDEELEEKYDGSCFNWDSEKWDNYDNEYIDTDTIDDAEDVEIFSDYGGGFSWKGQASRSKLVVTSSTNLDCVDWENHIPKWVKEYFKNKGWSCKYFRE